VAFEWQGPWVAMSFGLTIAPRLFSKTIKVVLRCLRAISLRVVSYMDYPLIVESTRRQCRLHLAAALRKLLWLGLTPSWDKCNQLPVQTVEFLGFALDSVSMTVRPTARAVEKVVTVGEELLCWHAHRDTRSPWWSGRWRARAPACSWSG